MNTTGERPKGSQRNLRMHPDVRAGDGPLPVGDVYEGAFAVVSRFDACRCRSCGYTESYRRMG